MNRPLIQRTVKVLLWIVVLMIVFPVSHRLMFSQYHQVKVGMTREQVEKEIMIGITPRPKGAGLEKTSLYDVSTGCVEVTYDDGGRVITKFMHYFRR